MFVNAEPLLVELSDDNGDPALLVGGTTARYDVITLVRDLYHASRGCCGFPFLPARTKSLTNRSPADDQT